MIGLAVHGFRPVPGLPIEHLVEGEFLDLRRLDAAFHHGNHIDGSGWGCWGGRRLRGGRGIRCGCGLGNGCRFRCGGGIDCRHRWWLWCGGWNRWGGNRRGFRWSGHLRKGGELLKQIRLRDGNNALQRAGSGADDDVVPGEADQVHAAACGDFHFQIRGGIGDLRIRLQHDLFREALGGDRCRIDPDRGGSRLHGDFFRFHLALDRSNPGEGESHLRLKGITEDTCGDHADEEKERFHFFGYGMAWGFIRGISMASHSCRIGG